MSWTVFLDRDGVLNEHPRFQVRNYEQFHWLPGAKEAISRLTRAGVRTCLVTNQPGTAMGLSKKADIEALHAQVQKDLEAVGARLDQIEACFAPPGIPNRRRKPRPGMLVDGAKALGTRGYPVEKDKAFMVGDQVRDAMAAKRYGIPCIVLATTRGSTALRERLDVAGLEDVDIEEDLAAAVDKILRKVNA